MKIKTHSKQKLAKKPHASRKKLTAAKTSEKIKKKINSRQSQKARKSFFETEHSITRDITARKQMEETLRESEEKYRTIIENIQDGYFEVDLAGNYTSANDAECISLGYPREELIGMNNRQYMEKEYAKKVFQAFNKLYKTGVPIKALDYEIIRKDGTKAFKEISTTLVRDSKGKPIGFRGITHDITARKQVESQREAAVEALRQSEEKYRNIIEQMTDGYYEIDLAGNYTMVTEANARLIGYSPDELLGKNFKIQTHKKEDAEILYNAFGNIYKTGKPARNISYTALHKDGTTGFAEITGFPMRDQKGNIIGFRGISRDITERKQAEERLRQSEERYRTILEEMIEGYYETDLSGNYTFVNDAICSRHGYSKEEMIGMNNRQYTDETTARKIYKIFTEIYKTGKTVEFVDYEIIRKDGTKYYIELSISLIKNAAGEPVGFRGVSRDITERKRAEETLRKSEEKYRSIIENMQEPYFENDLAGNFTFVNDALCKRFGYSKEELIGKNNRLYSDEENAKKTYQAYNIVYRTGEPVRGVELQYIRKGGMKGFSELSISLMRDAESKPIGFRCVSHDITERKKAEEAIRESEDKYKSLIENVPDIIFTIDLEGKITFVSRKVKEMLGYEIAEMIDTNIFNFIPEEDHQRAIESLQKGMKGEKIASFQIPIITKSGDRLFFECSFSRVYKDGVVVGAQGTAVDISERKRAEEERKQSFERLRKVLGATVQSISRTVEMRDPYTSGHQWRVSDLARAIATEMGLTADRQDFIRTAANIHDIGKIAIPAEILSKPTKLTALEFGMIKTHSESGYDILKDIEFPWPVADVVLQHHERMDGSGYPQGLKGDDILLEARILAIADVVEAIASHRPYRPSLGIDFAMEEISRNKGTLYDAAAVDACLRLFLEKGYTLVLKK